MPLDARATEPQEALAYWRSKAPVTSAQYKTLTGQAKARAFGVAGLARLDQVATVQQALTEALEKGETLAQFKKRLRPLLESKGWTGQKAWRVENIFRTNLQSAYQAGRYAQMKAVAKARPYWRYVAVKDGRTRPTHRALNGKVYPHDHPFWDTFYPPNGFMCRCTVQTLSQGQVDARGLKVEDRIPGLVEPIDPRTGNRAPAVPLRPDPGWAGNVGKDWLQGLSPSEFQGTLKDLVTSAVCRQGKGLFADGDPCRPSLSSLDPRHIHIVDPADILPKGLKPEEYVRAFLGEFGLADINGSLVHTLPGKIPVVIDKGLFVDKAGGAWKVLKNGRERYLRLLARTIKDPFEIWEVPVSASGRQTVTLRLLRLFAATGQKIGGFAVFNLVGGRHWTGTAVFTPGMERRSVGARERVMLRYLERQRTGTLLYREQ